MKIRRISTFLIPLLSLFVYSFKSDKDKFDVVVYRQREVNTCLESQGSMSSNYLESIPTLSPFVLTERFVNCSLSYKTLNRNGYLVDMNLVPIDSYKADKVWNKIDLHLRKENRKLKRSNNWNYIDVGKIKRLHLVLVIKDGSIISRHIVFMSINQLRKEIK